MTFEDEWEVPFKSGGAAGAVWRWAWGNVVCVSARPRGQRGSVAVGCPADHCGRTFALLDPDGKADCPVLVAWVGGGRERVTRLVEGRGRYCLNIGGVQIDEAVTRAFIAALQAPTCPGDLLCKLGYSTRPCP